MRLGGICSLYAPGRQRADLAQRGRDGFHPCICTGRRACVGAGETV